MKRSRFNKLEKLKTSLRHISIQPAKHFRTMIMRSYITSASLLSAFLFMGPPVAQGYSAPLKQGLEARVCMDRDCLTDGSKDTLALVQALAEGTDVTVTKCGCLGPCGSGPNVDLRNDGVRVKDRRPDQSDYFIFRDINSAEAAADMLRMAGVAVDDESVAEAKGALAEPTSSRKWYDLDRTSRINLQRLLYAITALPLLNAELNGTWDTIYGVVYPNSYYTFAGVVFVLSQFMRTGTKSNAMED